MLMMILVINLWDCEGHVYHTFYCLGLDFFFYEYALSVFSINCKTGIFLSQIIEIPGILRAEKLAICRQKVCIDTIIKIYMLEEM